MALVCELVAMAAPWRRRLEAPVTACSDWCPPTPSPVEVALSMTQRICLPGVDVTFGDVELELVIERNAVPVNEVQVVHVEG